MLTYIEYPRLCYTAVNILLPVAIILTKIASSSSIKATNGDFKYCNRNSETGLRPPIRFNPRHQCRCQADTAFHADCGATPSQHFHQLPPNNVCKFWPICAYDLFHNFYRPAVYTHEPNANQVLVMVLRREKSFHHLSTDSRGFQIIGIFSPRSLRTRYLYTFAFQLTSISRRAFFFSVKLCSCPTHAVSNYVTVPSRAVIAARSMRKKEKKIKKLLHFMKRVNLLALVYTMYLN